MGRSGPRRAPGARVGADHPAGRDGNAMVAVLSGFHPRPAPRPRKDCGGRPRCGI